MTKLWKWPGWALTIEIVTIAIGIYVYRWIGILLWAAYGR